VPATLPKPYHSLSLRRALFGFAAGFCWNGGILLLCCPLWCISFSCRQTLHLRLHGDRYMHSNACVRACALAPALLLYTSAAAATTSLRTGAFYWTCAFVLRYMGGAPGALFYHNAPAWRSLAVTTVPLCTGGTPAFYLCLPSRADGLLVLLLRLVHLHLPALTGRAWWQAGGHASSAWCICSALRVVLWLPLRQRTPPRGCCNAARRHLAHYYPGETTLSSSVARTPLCLCCRGGGGALWRHFLRRRTGRFACRDMRLATCLAAFFARRRGFRDYTRRLTPLPNAAPRERFFCCYRRVLQPPPSPSLAAATAMRCLLLPSACFAAVMLAFRRPYYLAGCSYAPAGAMSL